MSLPRATPPATRAATAGSSSATSRAPPAASSSPRITRPKRTNTPLEAPGAAGTTGGSSRNRSVMQSFRALPPLYKALVGTSFAFGAVGLMWWDKQVPTVAPDAMHDRPLFEGRFTVLDQAPVVAAREKKV